jgi:NADH dehydrogenase
MTRDNLASMSRDNVSDAPFPAVFGIEPRPLEAIAPQYLGAASARSRYDEFRAHGGR